MTIEGEFEAFVRETGARLYRTALLMSGDHHLAEDLTQTTYARLYASWRRVRHADDPLAYARTTLTRVYWSHARLRRSSERPVAEPVPESAVPGSDEATRLDLLAALRLLSPGDRLVLVLRYWEDRSVTQVAHDLGIREPAVRTRSKRALDRLRGHLDAMTQLTEHD